MYCPRAVLMYSLWCRYTPWGEVMLDGGLGLLLKLQATPELEEDAVDLALQNGNAYDAIVLASAVCRPFC
jgi:hypothetical protein